MPFYRRLGRTGLGVSPICLGTMGFGPPTQQAQVNALVHVAVDLGINFIDTANCYDGPNRGELVEGTSEKMLGIALKGIRDQVILLTKAGVPLRPGPQNCGLSTTHLLREIDQSLRRLQTDYVDIFMIHWPDSDADLEEVLRAIDMIIRSGRARYFGISNHQGWQVCEYLWIADQHHFPKVSVSEISLSILDRRFENDLPFYEKHQIGVIPYQPLKAGLLSGKYRRGMLSGATENPEVIAGWQQTPDEKTLDKIESLVILADSLGVDLAQYVLAWDLMQPAISSVIVGARCKEELVNALSAVNIKIPPDHLIQIDEIAPGPEKPRPRFQR